MTLIVQKYGGTSVGTLEKIQNVADRVIRLKNKGNNVVVVVSAMSGETNRLVEMANTLSANPAAREFDVLVSTGEQVTIALLCMALIEKGQPAKSYTGGQVKVLTDDTHNKARIKSIDNERINADLATGHVVVVAGFQGIDENNNITTLGRGGSDTSAVALAAALKADECQILTDVDGVYTTDPRVVANARKLDKITFEEMLEMASLGSKVLQIRSVEFAGKYSVPLRVLSSFEEEGKGTLITYDDEDNSVEQALISGIAFNRDEAQITLTGIPDSPGIAYKILGAVADNNIEVDMIVQNIGAEGCAGFSFTVHRNDYDNTIKCLTDRQELWGEGVLSGDTSIVKLSMVGVGMRSHAGIASKMFQVLSDEGINIQMISTSEIKISVVFNEKYLELGVRSLHEAFGLDQDKDQ